MNRAMLIVSAALLAGSGLPARAEAWSFAVTGGHGGTGATFNTSFLSRMAADIAAGDCRFVLVAGDLIPAQGDALELYSAWREAMAPVYRAGIPVYPVRGRNETAPDPDGLDWRKAFPRLPTNGPPGEVGLTYSFTFRDAFCAVLDQGVRPRRVNHAWLDAECRANTRPHVFVIGHEPAFRVRRDDGLAAHPAARDLFWASLRRAGARLYFCGRDPLYHSAAVIEGAKPPIFQVVAGSGGAPRQRWKGRDGDPRLKIQFSNTGLFGYNRVTVDERTVVMEWKALLPDGGWKVLDTLMIERPARVIAAPPAGS